VLQTTCTAALTFSPNPSAQGQPVTFTAKIASSILWPTGPVTFMAGKTVLGTGPLRGGKATLTTSSLPLGTTQFTATYYGNLNIAKSSASVTAKSAVNDAKRRWAVGSRARRKIAAIASRYQMSRARLSETQRRQATACHRWSPADHPKWLTEEVYANRIQPRLANHTLSQIASAIGVSIPYASDIRRGGRKPHPRHWVQLAALSGISVPIKTNAKGALSE